LLGTKTLEKVKAGKWSRLRYASIDHICRQLLSQRKIVHFSIPYYALSRKKRENIDGLNIAILALDYLAHSFFFYLQIFVLVQTYFYSEIFTDTRITHIYKSIRIVFVLLESKSRANAITRNQI